MSLLKTLREKKIINKFIREALKKSLQFQNKLERIVSRWPTSGTIECSFRGEMFFMYNECDDGFVQYFYYNLKYHEEHDLRLFIQLTKQSRTVLDIGANTGVFSILGSKANRDAHIYAIEPYKANYERLNLNLQLNKAENIYAHRVAIGSTNGQVEFTVPKDNRITDVSSADGQFSRRVYKSVEWISEMVDIKTIDVFVQENNLKIDLIKCDVENYEMEVFKGADYVLSEQRPTILFECFLEETRKSFFNKILEKYNYHVYLISESGIIYLDNGFDKNVEGGLNYLITPVKPRKSFVSFEEISHTPELILLSPKKNNQETAVM
ncbi:MAG: FkbM family methyltransferase [Segetibacter sp.]|nr:FkbM family methyltransferase [Segetibacter sp.]